MDWPSDDVQYRLTGDLMINGFTYSRRFVKIGYKVLSCIKRPLTSLILSLGLALAGASYLQVHAAGLVLDPPAQAAVRPESAVFSGNSLISETIQSLDFQTNDGIYLYGQSPEPNQVGSAYAIMEIVGNQAVGAFYMPQSSFDCFYGEVQSAMLALNVMSTYEQLTYQYSLPLSTSTVASVSPSNQPIQLSGYHGIESVSSNDHRILSICRSAVQNAR
ncbi:MAG: hypothetical protein F6K30_24715 [Cyanothece sp. SIO2G6]|nr:hypothetical protein [Cyanothece sp. SIO2G6]